MCFLISFICVWCCQLVCVCIIMYVCAHVCVRDLAIDFVSTNHAYLHFVSLIPFFSSHLCGDPFYNRIHHSKGIPGVDKIKRNVDAALWKIQLKSAYCLPFRFILLHFLPNLPKQRLQNVCNCEKSLTWDSRDELREGQ